MTLEPIPETRDAMAQLSDPADHDLVADLTHQAELTSVIVPSCVGLSLSLLDRGLTFTLVATSEQIAALDAVQYAFGGPCVKAVQDQQTVRTGDVPGGLLDEDRWATFARASAAHGVMSTLSMPVFRKGQLVFGVNIYAGTPDAMHGREDSLAALFGAWAPGATRNADLDFTSREQARGAPRVLEDEGIVDRAVGVIAGMRSVDAETARGILSDAAKNAGVDELLVARALLRGEPSEADG